MELSQVLGPAASMDLAHYRPHDVIDAVNTLIPLGAEGALDAVESYISERDIATEPQEELLLVLRVLFQVPDDPGYQPPLRLGGTSPPPPPALHSLPLFPLVLIDDIPLLIIPGFILAGDSESLSVQLRYYRSSGRVRARPLAPSKPRTWVVDQFETVYQHAYGTPPSASTLSLIDAQLSTLDRE
jgi:hypothetical protein